MSQSGLAPAGDDEAVRWVAVRHADDHIHIAATLVRQDGRTEWARNDYRRVRAAAMDLERRYGLLSTAPADGTATRRPGAREVNKATRQGRAEAPRETLRREVRAAAAIACDANDFFSLVEGRGVLVRLRHSVVNPDEVTGFAVALADHVSKDGTPIWYSGGRLAPDLTLPRLVRRWRNAGDRTGSALDAAMKTLRSSTANDRQKIEIGESAADLLTALSRAAGGKFIRAVDLFDRAVREPVSTPMPGYGGGGLRMLARAIGRNRSGPALPMLLQFLASLSTIADHIADIRASQQRIHQARAARAAAEQLRSAADRCRAVAFMRTAPRRATYGEPMRPRRRGR